MRNWNVYNIFLPLYITRITTYPSIPSTVYHYWILLSLQVTHLFLPLYISTPCFPFLWCEGMATVINWPLHVHYGITLWAYLSQTHRPNLRYYTVGIPFWTSCKTQSQTSKFDGKKHNVCSNSRDHTFMLHTCYREVYRNIACEENGWLICGKFITLLTFELSSFRENGFFFLLHFPHCTHWYLSLDA